MVKKYSVLMSFFIFFLPSSFLHGMNAQCYSPFKSALKSQKSAKKKTVVFAKELERRPSGVHEEFEYIPYDELDSIDIKYNKIVQQGKDIIIRLKKATENFLKAKKNYKFINDENKKFDKQIEAEQQNKLNHEELAHVMRGKERLTKKFVTLLPIFQEQVYAAREEISYLKDLFKIVEKRRKELAVLLLANEDDD